LLIEYFINSFNIFKAYRRYLFSSKNIIKVKAIFLINGFISIIFKTFIINLAYLFINF